MNGWTDSRAKADRNFKKSAKSHLASKELEAVESFLGKSDLNIRSARKLLHQSLSVNRISEGCRTQRQ
ncbi:hypothetical protein PSAB6_60072 [Paraburkholderia sabiae]|nr:hypothetical protein PSAB6_60072 [Paraburkholderia sabiae]